MSDAEMKAMEKYLGLVATFFSPEFQHRWVAEFRAAHGSATTATRVASTNSCVETDEQEAMESFSREDLEAADIELRQLHDAAETALLPPKADHAAGEHESQSPKVLRFPGKKKAA